MKKPVLSPLHCESVSLRGGRTLREFMLYVVVGGICTLTDIAMLYMLTSVGGMHYLVSSSLSFTLGVVLNWILCRHFVFEFHRLQRQDKEFACYVLISIVGLVINVLLMWLFTNVLCTWYLYSKLMAAAITVFYNFFARKLFLHTK